MVQRGLKGSQLKEVSSPKLVYNHIEKAKSDMLGGTGRATVSDVLDAELISLESDATAGGGATEAAMVITGLLETDEILSIHMMTQGANAVALSGYANQADDALDIGFTADPGAGAIMKLLVRRT